MEQTKTGFHPLRGIKRGVWLALGGLALAAVCFGAGFFLASREEEPQRLSSVTVEHQLQQISQLATTRYAYTNMGQFEQSSDFYGLKIPFTTKRFIVAYDGVITAGVELDRATVAVDERTVRVVLPPARILSHEIDQDSLEVFDETKNIFNPITIQDYNGFQADQKGALEEKALESGLLEQAGQQARAVVSGLLAPLLAPGQELDVTVSEG